VPAAACDDLDLVVAGDVVAGDPPVPITVRRAVAADEASDAPQQG
jgi:hypothetical protein